MFCLFVGINRSKKAKTWYVDAPLGENKIIKIMTNIAEMGGIVGRFTNHSARRTMCTQLLQSRLDPLNVSQLTGHKNVNSLIHYNTTSDAQQRAMCENRQSLHELPNPQIMPQTRTRTLPSATISRPPPEPAIDDNDDDMLSIPSTQMPTQTNQNSTHTLQPAHQNANLSSTQSSQVLRGMFAGATFHGALNINFQGIPPQ